MEERGAREVTQLSGSGKGREVEEGKAVLVLEAEG